MMDKMAVQSLSKVRVHFQCPTRAAIGLIWYPINKSGAELLYSKQLYTAPILKDYSDNLQCGPENCMFAEKPANLWRGGSGLAHTRRAALSTPLSPSPQFSEDTDCLEVRKGRKTFTV